LRATEETIEMILESGAWAGFTIYPNTKLSPERRDALSARLRARLGDGPFDLKGRAFAVKATC